MTVTTSKTKKHNKKPHPSQLLEENILIWECIYLGDVCKILKFTFSIPLQKDI